MNQNSLKKKIWPSLWQFIYLCIVLIGLPTLGWGWDGISSFLAHPVRLAYLLVVILQAIISAILVFITPPDPAHEHRFDLARWHSYMFETIAVLAAFGDRRGNLVWLDDYALRWVGLGIYIAGVVLSISANLTWTKYLKMEMLNAYEYPAMLSQGIYKYIRYPYFLWLFFYCLGLALVFRSWVGLVLILPLVGGMINRIHNLEKIMAKRYPLEWRSRSQTSRRFIPFIY